VGLWLFGVNLQPTGAKLCAGLYTFSPLRGWRNRWIGVDPYRNIGLEIIPENFALPLRD
jgi:hypothetical protein